MAKMVKQLSEYDFNAICTSLLDNIDVKDVHIQIFKAAEKSILELHKQRFLFFPF